jgi:carboxymethylenebutenolidase
VGAQQINLQAADGHRLSAWTAEPDSLSKGGVVVLHAIYGATTHMGDVCARWASAGYRAVAPALFDRLGEDLVFPYTQGAEGANRYAALTQAQIFADIQAAAQAANPTGLAVISGFCSGGSWAWRAAASTAMEFAAQVNFYGSQIPQLVDLAPRCPTILHYGDSDFVVPLAEAQNIAARYPQIEMHIYPGAKHAFENSEQDSYDADAGDLAWARSIAFLDRLTA